jgi:hypothetical protein
MEQNTSQTTKKSKIWVIGNIWSYIIAYSVAFGIIWRIISWLLFRYVGIGENFINILGWLVTAAVVIFGVRIGIRMVLKKCVILREDILKISVGVTVVLIIFQVIVTILFNLLSLTQIAKLAAIDISLFFITYYWLKKAAS